MLKLKEILAVLIAFCISFSIPAYSYEITEYTNALMSVKASEYLQMLNIITANEDIADDGEVLKGEALITLLKALNSTGAWDDKSFNEIYTDLNSSKILAEATSLGVSYGILDYTPEVQNSLTEKINVMQAAKMTVGALGYGVQATARGGYPTGYLSIATQLKLLGNLSADLYSPITKENFYNIIYHALDAKMLTYSAISKEGFEVDGQGPTLRQYYLDSKDWSIQTGIVDANIYMSFTSDKTDEGIVGIDGRFFEDVENKALDMIGYSVEFVTDNSTGSTGGKIIGIRKTKDNTTAVFTKADEITIANNKINFVKDNNKKSSIELDPNHILIYNNGLLTNYDPADIDYSNGQSIFIDNNGDEVYDVVKIWSGSSFVVKNVDATNKKIYVENPEYSGQNVINMDADDDEIFEMFNADGEKIDWDALSQGSSITIYKSHDKKYTKLVLVDSKIEGTVTAISQSPDFLEIDGNPYSYTKHFDMVAAGTTATFYLNEFDEIFYCTQEDSDYAFLIAADTSSAHRLSKLEIKLLIPGEGVVILPLSKSVRVDGTKYNSRDAVSRITLQSVITYNINSLGEVNKIDHAEIYAENAIRTFREAAVGFNDGRYLQSTPFKFDEKTQIFYVPLNGEDEDYEYTPKLADGKEYTTEGYDFNVDTSTVEAVVVWIDTDSESTKPLNSSSQIGIITGVKGVRTTEDIFTTLITGYSEGEEFSLLTSDVLHGTSSVSTLKRGDIIRFICNHRDEIVKIKKVISLADDISNFHYGHGSDDEQILGNVMRLNKFMMTNFSNYLMHEMYVSETSQLSNMNLFRFFAHTTNSYSRYSVFKDYYILDKSDDEVRIGSVEDILSAENAFDSSSRVFVQQSGAEVQMIVVIKE